MKFVKVLLISVFSVLVLLAFSAYVILTYYKKEMADMFIETLKKEHGLELQAEDIRVSFFNTWPHASVQFKNVNIKSHRFEASSFSAGALSLSFNIERLLNREFIVRHISVRNAEIIFIKPGERPPERTVDDPESPAAVPVNFEVSRITFKNTKFRFLNPAIGQQISVNLINNTLRMEHFSDGISASFTGRLRVPGLLFREGRGEFLKDSKLRVNLDFDYFKDSSSLCFRPGSYADVNGHRYNISSLLNLGENKTFSLLLESRDVDYKSARALLNERIRKGLKSIEIEKPFDAKMLLVVNIGKREDPVFIIDLESKNNDLVIGAGKTRYSDISFNGKIVCMEPSMQRGDIDNAKLILKNVSGRVYDLPFTADISLFNFRDPLISVNGRMDIDAAKVKLKLSNEFELKGRAIAKVSYSGPVTHLNSRQFLDPVMKLRVEMSLNNISYKEKGKPWVYTLLGKAKMDNTDMTFTDMLLKTDAGEAMLTGRVEGFANYLFGRSNGFKANLAVKTENFDLNPVLLKQSAEGKAALLVAGTDNDTLAVPVLSNSAMVNAAEAFTRNYSSFEFNVGLFARKMRVRNVLAGNAHMHLHYKDEVLDIRALEALVCGGRIKGSGNIRNFNNIKAKLLVEDVDVGELFRQFENFGQEAVVSENLEGRIYAEADFKTLLDNRMEIAGETMYSEVKLRLKEGRLINYEPIQQLSSFIFRKRDLNNISFSELNQSFILRGYEMQIDELEIGSNILDLYVVNGLYNFKGHSNINVLLPWSNLKKRKKNFLPVNSGESAENTKGLKLNFSGPSKNLKISLGHKELVQMKPSI